VTDGQQVRSLATDPELLAGWEPHAPEGDTLLRRFVRNWAEGAAGPVAAAGGRVLRTDGLVAADLGRPAGFANRAVLLAPLALEDVAATAARLAGFTAGGTGDFLLFSAWPTPDLHPFGWELEGHPPLLLLPPGAPVAGEPVAGDLVVERVDGPAALADFERVAIESYPLDELRDRPPGTLTGLTDPKVHRFIGRTPDGEAAAVAETYAAAGVNGVALVATTAPARGRGYGTAVTAAAGRAVPGWPAMLLSSDEGRPVYERMGYLPLLRLTCWSLARTDA
jgi:hypothetical protein